MGNAKPKVTLSNAYMDMFKSTDPEKIQEEEAKSIYEVVMVDGEQLIPFSKQPFKLYTGEKQESMINSIKDHGIFTPLIVRPFEDKYQIVAGHNRFECGKIAGLTQFPCIIRDLDDDTATILMIDSNLNQREEILPSERAWAYKLKLEAIKRQGERSDLTSVPQGQKLSVGVVANENDMSITQVKRYIRLTELTPELLELVDSGKLQLSYAVELSYLKHRFQMTVLKLISEDGCKLTNAVCSKLKQMSKDKTLNDDKIRKAFTDKPKPKTTKAEVKIPYTKIAKYNIPKNKMQEVIIKALELYYSQVKEG